MNKKERQQVHDKYGGKCAYCGCELGKRWCADHIEPIRRFKKRIGGNYVTKDTGTEPTYADLENGNYMQIPSKLVHGGCENPENDNIDNINPACFSCNSYKNTMTLEMFREQVGLLVDRLNKYYNQYKIAKRFGLVEETGIKVYFYYERFENKTP